MIGVTENYRLFYNTNYIKYVIGIIRRKNRLIQGVSLCKWLFLLRKLQRSSQFI